MALSWNAPPGVTFLPRLHVEASDDLDVWRVVVPSAVIAHDSLTLTQNEVALPQGPRSKYLRLSWPRELDVVSLTAVRVRPRTAAAEVAIRWRTLNQDHTEPSGAAAYDARALLPVEYVDLEFAYAADAVSVDVLSRPDASSE